MDVTIVDIKPQNTPAAFEYTGKTESSREVEIRARITGYLDEIAYQEGSLVKQGQLLFIGHEIGGWIEALGPGVSGFDVGQPCW